MSVYVPEIVVDTRESYEVRRYLRELGSHVAEKAISPADYVVSESCAVERKAFGDFLRSVYDGRLFEQVERLADAYENPYLVVEGPVAEGLSEIQNPLVFWGALARVTAEWGVSIIFTPDEEHTAMFIHSLAKKLQEEEKRKVAVKHKPRLYTLAQRQLLAAQSLPHIGPERAERLLRRFGSLRRVFTASDEELLAVEGIGKKIAQGIRELLDTKFSGLEES